MSTALWFIVPGVIVAFLIASLLRRFSSDRIAALNERRRFSSSVVSRAEFIDGQRHLDVALALTDSAFIYENADMQAFLERKWIHEVEYENELSTGQPVPSGKVLRLRCFSRTFEFVIPTEFVSQWQTALPAHQMSH